MRTAVFVLFVLALSAEASAAERQARTADAQAKVVTAPSSATAAPPRKRTEKVPAQRYAWASSGYRFPTIVGVGY